MKTARIFFPVIALLLSGCSTIGLVYRNADVYLQHKIYGYTAFTPGQKAAIDLKVADYMRWHREKALPEYVSFLQNLNGTAQYDGQLGIESAQGLRMQLLNLYRMTVTPAIRPTADLLSQLDSEQIRILERNFAEDDRKHEAELQAMSRAEYLDRRADRTLEFAEWLAGDLSDSQKQSLREMSHALPEVNRIYLKVRESNQAQLVRLLDTHAGPDKVAAFLSAWFLTPEQLRTPEQQRQIDAFDAGSDQMVMKLHDSLTQQQKDHIHERISGYIDAIHALTSHPGSADTPH